MSSPELCCPRCFTSVETGVMQCPNPECGIAFIRCRNPSCAGLLAPGDDFCSDCGTPAKTPAPSPPPAPLPPAPAPSPPAAVAAPSQTSAAPPAPEAPPPDLSAILAALQMAGGSLAPGTPVANQPTTANPAPATNPINAPVFASPATASVAASAGASLSQSLQAEYQTPSIIKKGQQAYLGVRVLAGGRDPLDIRGEIQSGLFMAELASTHVVPASLTTFTPARFVPTVSGSDTARITLTARTSSGVPAGRWTADVFLTVEDDVKQAYQITNTGGGDVVLYGAPQPTGTNPAAALPPIWRMLSLAPDLGFQRRIARLRAPTAVPPPAGEVAPPGQALVVIEDQATRMRTTMAMVCGSLATIGRGGKPDTTWWVQSEPLNRSAHLNISGLHAAINIRDGYAWVTDCSRFGTQLNNAPLAPKEATVLADGDELDLAAGGFRSRVGLAADAAGVGALWLSRTDAHAGRLTYALCSRPIPVPVLASGTTSPLGWLAWTARPGGGALLQFRAAETSSWIAVPPDQPISVAPRFRIAWRSIAAPRNQELDLNPTPPLL